MTEPTAPPIDEPVWVETRGPHLPDRLTAIPLLVWPFVVLAIVQVIALWQDNQREDLWVLARSALGAVGDITFSLLGAALFLRHRDAIRTLPMLVAGVSLLAVGEVFHVISASLQPIFESVWPAIDDATGAPIQAMIASALFREFVLLIGVFGTLYLARGLDGARRFEGGTSRLVVAGLVVLAGVTTGMLVIGFLGVPGGAIIGGALIPALSAGISLGSSLATAYLIVVALAGWRAGEEPSTGWWLVVVSGLLTMVASAIYIATVVWQIGDLSLISLAYSTMIAIAGVALLAAFLLGLPSTEQIEWEEVKTEAEPDADAEAALEPRATLDPPVATTPGSAGS